MWAWHRGRVPKVAAALTKLLCFFPFEPELFNGTGLDAKFIGHPLVKMVENEIKLLPEAAAVSRKNELTLALLPGSRRGEIQRILPRLLKAVALMQNGSLIATRSSGKPCGQTLKIVIPAANGMAEREIARIIASFDGLPPIEVQRGNARALLREATCAAVASGTATLEAALVRCPTVLVYAVSPLLAWILRRAITGVRHAGLANIIAEKCGFNPPMPELLQEAFTPEAAAGYLNSWLADESARREASAKLDEAMSHLKADGDPLEIAAREILGSVTCQSERVG